MSPRSSSCAEDIFPAGTSSEGVIGAEAAGLAGAAFAGAGLLAAAFATAGSASVPVV